MKRSIVGVILFAWIGAAAASPHPWPFDFDSQISPHQAYIDQRIGEFSAGLPGVPDAALTEVVTGAVRLYFYPEMADAFFRARDAGPGFAATLARDPVLCQQHGNFSPPALNLASNTLVCQQAKARLEAAFADSGQACLEVEFPEIYVLAYQAGPIPPSTLTSFEGLISLCGEALMHVDFQENLFAPTLIGVIRDAIAKLRYEGLLAATGGQRTAYQDAVATLGNAAGCFAAADVDALNQAIPVLAAELDAAEQSLIALYQDGLNQAAADLAAIGTQGRVREALLHPALSDRERLLLSFYIGGIYWRMRGAGLVAEPPDPDQGLLRRLYFVRYPYQLIGELNGGLIDAENVGLNIFIQENWGYADWMDMGTNPGLDKYADLVDMTDRGREATTLVAPLLSQRGYDVRDLVYGGLMMGACYYYAWEELRNYQLGPDLQYPYMWFLECPTAVGEFCTGGSLALGLARSLLWGKPGATCEPDCTDKACGDNGCGGSCGQCAAGQACTGGVCQACAPDCAGRVCGDDGCGGACGTCAGEEICQGGQCVCAPDCAERSCGDDGCGGSCGACIGQDQCLGGQCVCAPNCVDKLCGPDGCGGSCGSCDPGQACLEGVCQVCDPACAGKVCGDDGCGGSCGACAAEQACQDGACVDVTADGGDPCPAGDCDQPSSSAGCGCGPGSAGSLGALFALAIAGWGRLRGRRRQPGSIIK